MLILIAIILKKIFDKKKKNEDATAYINLMTELKAAMKEEGAIKDRIIEQQFEQHKSKLEVEELRKEVEKLLAKRED